MKSATIRALFLVCLLSCLSVATASVDRGCNRVLSPSRALSEAQAGQQEIAFELARLYVSLSKTNGIAAAGDRTKFQALIQAYEKKHPGILRDVRLQVQALQVDNRSQGMVSRELVDRPLEEESWNQLDQENQDVRRRWDVCQRTLQVRKQLEEIIGKPCNLIDESDLAQIRVLDLRHRGISNLMDYDFVGLVNVETIDFGLNDIRSLPAGLFHGLRNLRTITAHLNLIESLSRSQFQGLEKLEYVDFSLNKLEAISKDLFKENSRLIQIWLAHNRLKKVNLSQFLHLKKLEKLQMKNNPIPEAVKNELKEKAESFKKDGRWRASVEI